MPIASGRVLPLLFLLCFGAGLSRADGLSCESSRAVQSAEREFDRQLEGATFERTLALREAAYRKLILLDPGDYRPVSNYLMNLHYAQPEKFFALRDKAAADHPETAVQFLTDEILIAGKDTPRALQLLNEAAEKFPNYAPVYLQQAGLHERAGKYADKDKAAEDVAQFYQMCPSSADARGLRYLKQLGSDDLKKSVARNLRARLAVSQDADLLRSYAEVWSLEFATMPVSEHEKERRRVAEDLDRLEKLPIQPSAEWLDFLKDGYKQSGAPEARIAAAEDRILKEFPQSDQAATLVYDRWNDQHPKPADGASAADWQQYARIALAEFQEIGRRFPQEHYLGYSLVEWSATLNDTPADEIVRRADEFLKESDLYGGPSSWSRQYVAGVFLQHQIEAQRALALLNEARQIRKSPREQVTFEVSDYAKPKEVEDAAKNLAADDVEFNLLYLRACHFASDKTAAEQLKAAVEAPAPGQTELLSPYWNSRALLAELEGRTTDALAFYQKALFTREPPKPRYGKLDDFLLADAKHLWSMAQGSESAFAVWSQRDSAAQPVLAEGRWEKPEKDLPAFELTDLQGKTWKLASLEGKKVLINVWATWCGPCQSELPRLQKLYEETRERSDIAIITLNFDEDQGMIEPFVKKKGYTFPVLPAYALLSNKIDVNSIPRNWLVGSNGKWLWEQIGFDSGEADWGKSMLAHLEELK